MPPRTPSLRTAALAPLAAVQVLSAYKSFEDSSLVGSSLLNRWGLYRTRVRLAHRLAERRRLAPLVSAEQRDAFERDGFLVRERVLLDDAFAELLEQVEAYRGRVREKREGDRWLGSIGRQREPSEWRGREQVGVFDPPAP